MKKAPNPADKHVGARVRMRRMMLGMSQERLADSLDLTFQQVQKYEKGTNRIGASRLQHIATILQVPPSFFFEGLAGADQAAPVDAGSDLVTRMLSIAHGHGVDLARAFLAIENTKHRLALVQIAEGLARQPEILGRAA